MRGLILTSLLLASVAAPAVANDWREHFHGTDAIRSDAPASRSPTRVRVRGDMAEAVESWFQRGYVDIGWSQFASDNDSTRDAARFGQAIGAEVVLVAVDKTGEGFAYLPDFSRPKSLPAFALGSAIDPNVGALAAIASGGDVTPLFVESFDKLGVYLVRDMPGSFGILPRPLDRDEVTQVGSQRGIAVRAVRHGSLAERADLIPGDIITEADGRAIETGAAGLAQLRLAGRLRVVRDGAARDLVIPGS